MQEKQILLIPGPTPVPPRVLRAMGAPAVNHRGPAFKKLLVEVTEGVKKIFQTQNDLLILTSSGSGAMEAAVTNFLSPGDKALVVSIGSFGERFKKICTAFDVQVEALDFPWGTAADPNQVAERLSEDPAGEIKAILIQQNETSTGVLNDIEAISRARGNHPALLIVDAISGLVAADLPVDKWGLDVVLAGSQKAFMIPPGLAMVSVSERAWEVAEKASRHNFYFDLRSARDFYEKGETPYTPAVSLFFGLEDSLRMLSEEGLPNAFARHARYRSMVRAAIETLGLELLSGDEVASPAVTAVKPPVGFTPGRITGTMRDRYNVILAGGQGKLKDKIFRIGHLGYVDENELLAAIACLELTLKELGFDVDPGQGVAAAQRTVFAS